MWLAVLILLALATLAGSGHTALELSSDHQYYRKYYAVLGLKMGRWQLLPPVIGITVKYYSSITRVRAKYNQGSTRYRSEEVVVMLSVKGSTTGFIIGRFATDEVNTAIDLAYDTATGFRVPVNMYLPPDRFTSTPL